MVTTGTGMPMTNGPEEEQAGAGATGGSGLPAEEQDLGATGGAGGTAGAEGAQAALREEEARIRVDMEKTRLARTPEDVAAHQERLPLICERPRKRR
jgi:hypothetical protein